MRDLISLILAAWSSKHAIKVLPVVLLAFFSLVSAPLVEGPSNGGKFLELLVPSAIALPLALLALWTMWFFTYRKKNQPIWMLFLVTSIAGGIRGAGLFFAGELVGPEGVELPSLLARVVTAVTTWNLTLASFAIINYLVLSPTEKWYRLRRELLELDEEIQDSKLQLQWLINRKIRGLEQELRAEFLTLSQRLRSNSQSAEQSYSELAAALKGFANDSVRNRSRKIWDARAENSPLMKAAAGAALKNPFVLASVSTYLLGYLINEIRVYGFSFGLVPLFLSSLSYLLMVVLAKRISRGRTRNLSITVVSAILHGLVSGFLYVALLPERTPNYAIATALTATLWAMASLFISGWLKISIDLYADELKELANKRELSESELSWLEAQLSSTNREIAKYLHGILQSRLMAHALTLENHGVNDPNKVEEILQDIEKIMSEPMDAFLEQTSDLLTELERIKLRWSSFVELEFDELKLSSTIGTEATIQVIQEALSNAFRHGGATAARISVQDSGSKRLIDILDNGSWLTTGKRGLGSEILSSLTNGQWSISSSNQGSLLRAAVKID